MWKVERGDRNGRPSLGNWTSQPTLKDLWPLASVAGPEMSLTGSERKRKVFQSRERSLPSANRRGHIGDLFEIP